MKISTIVFMCTLSFSSFSFAEVTDADIDAVNTRIDSVSDTFNRSLDSATAGIIRNRTDIANLRTATDTRLIEQKSLIDTNTAAISQQDQDIQNAYTHISSINTALSGHINTNTTEIIRNKINIASHDTRITTNTVDIDELKKRTSDVSSTVANHETRISTNEAAIENHQTQIDNNTATLQNHEQRISMFESNNNQNFKALKSQVDNNSQQIKENRKIASAGIASVGAMANIPPLNPGSNFSMGLGTSVYDSESALAVGGSMRFSNNVVTKASIATNSAGKTLVGAGLSVEW